MGTQTPEELNKLNLLTQHSLKREDLMQNYTEEELKELLTADYSYDPEDLLDLATLRYTEEYEETVSEMKQRKTPLIHKWTPHEDEFIRNNYMFLSDTVIALALNVPKNRVYMRRKILGLSKARATNLELIIWADRDRFEEDVKKQSLSKARPEILL